MAFVHFNVLFSQNFNSKHTDYPILEIVPFDFQLSGNMKISKEGIDAINNCQTESE